MASAAHDTPRGSFPAPPGGHALRIDRTAPPRVVHPIVREVSAGGIVVRHTSTGPEAAVIARRNRMGKLEWCLPKGHLEGEETPEQAAVREIAEETGITGRITQSLGAIDYWFAGTNRRVHKVVHHYLLMAIGGLLTVELDPDQEAEEAAWINLSDLTTQLAYVNERKLVATARRLLSEDA